MLTLLPLSLGAYASGCHLSLCHDEDMTADPNEHHKIDLPKRKEPTSLELLLPGVPVSVPGSQ